MREKPPRRETAPARPLWLPAPRSARLDGGTSALSRRAFVAIDPPGPLAAAAARLTESARRSAGADWQVIAGAVDAEVRVRVDGRAHDGAEGYRLRVGEAGVAVEAGAVQGAVNGLRTLTQLVRQYGLALPTLVAEDRPLLPIRGVMLDVSRTKVPTMPALFVLIERLAELKVNHLELYMEHTFAYRDHREVWEGASPFTGAELLELDAHCRALGIDLVPNQNTLGHLHRWLERPRYRALAECPDGSEFPWGHQGAFSLAPALPESLALVRSLLDELLAHFTSRYVNIGLDETYDVGQERSRALVERDGMGRVLVDYLGKVSDHVRSGGRTPLYWADMVTRHHPEEIPHLPEDGIALEWGYGPDHDWAHYVAPIAAAGRAFMVCPGTSSWRSFTGRNGAAQANILAAARAAERYGAVGLVNTDWGDEGHMQPLPVSYWPLALGAAAAWGGEGGLGDDFDGAVGLHLFGDPTGEAGRLANRLGRLHTRTGERAPQAEDPFLSLALYRPERLDALRTALAADTLDRVRAEIRAVLRDLPAVAFPADDGALVRWEFAHAADALLLACDVLDPNVPRAEARSHLLAWREEFRALWPRRFRPGGLDESLAFLAPLEASLSAG